MELRKPGLCHMYAACDQKNRKSHTRIFVVRCQDSMMPDVVISEIRRIMLASIGEQAGLSHLVRFPHDVDQIRKGSIYLSCSLKACMKLR